MTNKHRNAVLNLFFFFFPQHLWNETFNNEGHIILFKSDCKDVYVVNVSWFPQMY